MASKSINLYFHSYHSSSQSLLAFIIILVGGINKEGNDKGNYKKCDKS